MGSFLEEKLVASHLWLHEICLQNNKFSQVTFHMKYSKMQKLPPCFFCWNCLIGITLNMIQLINPWGYWLVEKISSENYIVMRKWLVPAEFLGDASTFTWVFLFENVCMLELGHKTKKTCGSESIIDPKIISQNSQNLQWPIMTKIIKISQRANLKNLRKTGS